MTVQGVDVSNYQGLPNWQQVAQHVGFGIAKASEGVTYRDPTFAHNWGGMQRNGIRRIAYHFFHPDMDAVAQADYFHSAVHDGGHFGAGDAAALDLEVSDGMPPVAVIDAAAAFILRIRERVTPGGGPIQVLLYTYPDFWLNQLGNPKDAVLASCPLWIADYGAQPPKITNWPTGAAFWQYSSSGTVPGIQGQVDLNKFLGTEAQLNDILASPVGV